MNVEESTENSAGLVAVKQAAKILAVSPRTVWRMIADGEFKAVRVRGCTRLLVSEVTKYSNGGNQLECV